MTATGGQGTASRREPITSRLVACLLAAAPAGEAAAFDLSRATVEQLDNGLTLLVLEERRLPLVSVQMLYRAGARDDPLGLTGLAHYLEHMAFRSTESFPGTQITRAIDAVGGEWHGYTWLDQTTYFETVPSEHLDLALRIEADRMQRLIIAAEEVEAERGAVLAELHGYENDPASVLRDAVLYAAFQAHPYRNNTIGWESDVRHIGRNDLVGFYRRHYQPANAVLAVAGDVATAEVGAAVRRLFSAFPARPSSPPPHTVEPAQTGERRITLQGLAVVPHFEIVYRAPAVASPDYPAFLVVQELLGGSSGVNFRQDSARAPVRRAARLAGLAEDLSTWFPPAAQPYVFSISGAAPTGTAPADIEAAIERQIAGLRDTDISATELAAARARVLAELVFDIETTEDAAHQLAFFAGLDALEVLRRLPDALAQVTPSAIRSVAQRYLQASQRTVGWFMPGPPQPPAAGPARPPVEVSAAAPSPGRASAARDAAISRPLQRRLRNGIPVILQQRPLSPASHFRMVLRSAGADLPDEFTRDDPAWGYASLSTRAVPDDLQDAIATARRILDQIVPAPALTTGGMDPSRRLEQTFRQILGVGSPPQRTARVPVVLVATGDFDPEQVWEQLQTFFSGVRFRGQEPLSPLKRPQGDVVVTLPGPVPLARLGYVMVAPPPRDPAAMAWRLLLYIFSHDYQGRLGHEAIARRGLVYHIDSRYRSDGERAWISLDMGVDPGQLRPMQRLLREELTRLQGEPPTDAEIAEAKAHWRGRLRTAAQSNAATSAVLAQSWLWYETADPTADITRRLEAIRREEILSVVPAFIAGAIVTVAGPPAVRDAQS